MVYVGLQKPNGTAIIEVWGAGGSGARMCCCGDGLTGNAGAYVKKTITVETGDTMTGCTGGALLCTITMSF